MSDSVHRPLTELSNTELQRILDQIGRNGEPAPGSAPAERAAEIEAILAERQRLQSVISSGVAELTHPAA